METMRSHERLKKFVKHELAQIEKPGNPGQVHRFPDPQRLAKALCDFLAFPVDEPTVGRLESAFWNAVEPLLAEDLAVRSLPDCVEKLAVIFAALAHYGQQRVSEATLLLLSQGTITLQHLVACPLGDYIEIDEKFLRASPDFGNYFTRLLKSGSEDQRKFALTQTIKLGLGDLLREPLVEIIRSFRSMDPSPTLKQYMRVYEALKGQRFRGAIMLLDALRGIGSIWCDETHQFYFFHQSEVWETTPLAVYDAVEYEVATGRKPKKDFDAIKITKLSQAVFRGVIDTVTPERSFGFLKTEEDNTIFFHFDNVSTEEIGQIVPGARVSFILVPRLKDPQRVQAARVQLADCR